MHVWVAGHFDPKFRSTIFFLTPFRMFELCLGAMALQADIRPLRARYLYDAAMALGLALIGYAAVTFTDALIFPYYWALIPCAGTFLVIVSGRALVVGALLTNRVAVGIGLISYSLYLAPLARAGVLRALPVRRTQRHRVRRHFHGRRPRRRAHVSVRRNAIPPSRPVGRRNDPPAPVRAVERGRNRGSRADRCADRVFGRMGVAESASADRYCRR